jgi:hypothetical protein
MSSYGNSVYGQSFYGPTLGSSGSNLAHTVTVNSISLVYSDNTIHNTSDQNQFDEHGSILSLPRLRGETNASYKRRILNAGVYLANSSYRGLVHGITRELGLTLFQPICIKPRVGNNGRFVAPDPYIRLDGVWLLLYSDYANNKLDWAIDRFEPGGNFEHLGRLVNQINLTSTFEAHLVPGIDPWTRSMVLLNQSNREYVRFERIPASSKFQLRHQHLVPGSVFFANRTTFRREVYSEADVTQPGRYYIDYFHGIVRVFAVPTSQGIVRYKYTMYPFCPIASPVILNDINSEAFRHKMFEQLHLVDGSPVHGKPTELGVDIINELLTVHPMYWGV